MFKFINDLIFKSYTTHAYYKVHKDFKEDLPIRKTFKHGDFWDFFSMYCIQHCRPSDSGKHSRIKMF